MIKKQDDPVGSMFHDIAHFIRLKIDDMLRPYGLTRLKWLAIGIIADNEGLSQSALANRLELKGAATGKLVDRLVERGLADRHPDPTDRRAHRLYATPKSRALLAELEPLSGAIRMDVLHGLGREEIDVLTSCLRKIKTNLLRLALGAFSTTALKSAFVLPMI